MVCLMEGQMAATLEILMASLLVALKVKMWDHKVAVLMVVLMVVLMDVLMVPLWAAEWAASWELMSAVW